MAPQYRMGDLVWYKLHRRSNANSKLTRKIHLVYDRPYQIRNIIRRNAYELADLDGQSIGVFNSRQLRSHLEARMQRYGEKGEQQDVNLDGDCTDGGKANHGDAKKKKDKAKRCEELRS